MNTQLLGRGGCKGGKRVLDALKNIPWLSPGDLPVPGSEPRSPALQADSLPTELGGEPEVDQEMMSNK